MTNTNTNDPQILALLNSIVTRLDAIETKLSASASSSNDNDTTTNDDDNVHPSIPGYDQFLTESLDPFLTNLDGIHADATKLTTPIRAAFQNITPILIVASKCQKPKEFPGALLPLMKPVQEEMAKIRKLRLPRDLDLNQRCVEEMLACLSWVVVEKTPVPFVKEVVASAEYYSNKIRREFKNKANNGDKLGKSQITFCDQLKSIVLALADYVKEFHLTGLSFNTRGGPFTLDVATITDDDSNAAPAPAPTPTAPAAKSAPAAVGGINAIMAELQIKQSSAGDSAATGLKKVTKDMQTWRKEFKATDNANTSTSKCVTSSVPVKKPTAKKAASAVSNKAPVCEFKSIGSKWIIEYQTKEQNTSASSNGVISIECKDPKHQVYIYKCSNVTIDVKGKCKGIVVDGCTRVNVLFDNIISVVELVNGKNLAIQTRGVVPNVAIDKTAGCMVYLSKESAPVTTFVTSTSSEMNVSWPSGDKDDELTEKPIPEQFMHKLVNGGITSEVSELYC